MKCKRNDQILGLCIVLCCTTTFADTLYLRDGSVLIGSVTRPTEDMVQVTNEIYGDVIVPRDEILYHAADLPNVTTDCYTVWQDGAAVLARVQRTIPNPCTAEAFNLLLPGRVQSILDPNGAALPYDRRDIADNSLVSVPCSALSPAAGSVTVLTRQTDLIQILPSGEMAFQLKYLFNEDRHIRVIVILPAAAVVRSVTPDPILQKDGLIIWEQSLQRQQQFKPQVLLGP